MEKDMFTKISEDLIIPRCPACSFKSVYKRRSNNHWVCKRCLNEWSME